MPYLKPLACGPFQTNAFLVGAEVSPEAVLIDAPPDSYDEVMKALEADRRHLAAVLITHPHLDHTLDAHRYEEHSIPILALADAVREIAEPSSHGLFPSPPGGFPGAQVSSVLNDGEVVEFAGLSFQTYAVPGHCNGSAAFYVASEDFCFVGDLIFRGSIGRTDLAGGDFDLLAESIQNRIYTLPGNTVLYPGHGPETEVGTEKRSNPYVRG